MACAGLWSALSSSSSARSSSAASLISFCESFSFAASAVISYHALVIADLMLLNVGWARRGGGDCVLNIYVKPVGKMSSATGIVHPPHLFKKSTRSLRGKRKLGHTVCTVLNIRPVFGILRFAALGIANSQWMPCRAAHTQPKIFVSTTSIRVLWSDRNHCQCAVSPKPQESLTKTRAGREKRMVSTLCLAATPPT